MRATIILAAMGCIGLLMLVMSFMMRDAAGNNNWTEMENFFGFSAFVGLCLMFGSFMGSLVALILWIAAL